MSDLSPAMRDAMDRTGPWHRPASADADLALRKWCIEQGLRMTTGDPLKAADEVYDWVTRAKAEPTP